MLKNIESDIQNQITFGVLALNRMLERKALEDALAQDTLSEAHETLNTAVRPEHRDILTFIFRNLFAAEKDTQRIRETLDTIDDIDVPDFVNAYRNRDNEIYGSYTSGDIEKLATAFFARMGYSPNTVPSLLTTTLPSSCPSSTGASTSSAS